MPTPEGYIKQVHRIDLKGDFAFVTAVIERNEDYVIVDRDLSICPHCPHYHKADRGCQLKFEDNSPEDVIAFSGPAAISKSDLVFFNLHGSRDLLMVCLRSPKRLKWPLAAREPMPPDAYFVIKEI